MNLPTKPGMYAVSAAEMAWKQFMDARVEVRGERAIRVGDDVLDVDVAGTRLVGTRRFSRCPGAVSGIYVNAGALPNLRLPTARI